MILSEIEVYVHKGECYESVTYEEIGMCPLCHVALHPDILQTVLIDDEELYIVAFCPACEGVFFLTYLADRSTYRLKDIFPNKYESVAVPESIKTLSPKFSEVYSQAESAEDHGLTEICGMGYRRALEFLVKDYLCQNDSEHEEEIKKQPLAACIKNRITDHRIKTLAERATWIGNDETHYIRKHENLDVQDMKLFIRAMMAYIEAEQAFEYALSIEPQK